MHKYAVLCSTKMPKMCMNMQYQKNMKYTKYARYMHKCAVSNMHAMCIICNPGKCNMYAIHGTVISRVHTQFSSA